MRRELLRLPDGFREEISAAALVLAAIFIAGSLMAGAGDSGRACWAAGGHFGPVGACLRLTIIATIGGVASAIIPFLPLLAAASLLDRLDRERATRWLAFLAGLAVLLCIATALVRGRAQPGGAFESDHLAGAVGSAVAFLLVKPLGSLGAWLIVALATYALVATTIARDVRFLLARPPHRRPRRGWRRGSSRSQSSQANLLGESQSVLAEANTSTPTSAALPSPDLLISAPTFAIEPGRVQGDAVEYTLIAALRGAGVEASVVGRKLGPTVARYDVQPSPASPMRDRDALAAQLSTALHMPVRVAPIPESGAVGVELPRAPRVAVNLRDLIGSPEFRHVSRALPLAMGRDLDGAPMIADLAKMPNLLVVGEPASGKSVFVRSLIASLLYTHAPATLRFLMADADEGGLAVYDALPHLSRSVVTDYRKVASLLDLALLYMRSRNELRVANGARNIQELNHRASAGSLTRVRPGTLVDGRPYDGGPLPYVVVLIDDLFDLVRTGGPEIERSLTALAEKARVVGIHVVGVTKHASVDVVTPAFRAAFPARVAFRVAGQTNSRAIIDVGGAESLVGSGDMLFLPPGKSEPARLQAAYTSVDDTRRLVDWYGGEGVSAATEAVTAEKPAHTPQGNGVGEDLQERSNRLPDRRLAAS